MIETSSSLIATPEIAKPRDTIPFTGRFSGSALNVTLRAPGWGHDTTASNIDTCIHQCSTVAFKNLNDKSRLDVGEVARASPVECLPIAVWVEQTDYGGLAFHARESLSVAHIEPHRKYRHK